MTKLKNLKYIFILISSLIFSASQSQPTVTGGQATAVQMVERLVGDGVTVQNISFVGTAYSGSKPTLSNRGYFEDSDNTLGFDSGLILSTGNVYDLPYNTSGSKSKDFGFSGDNDLKNAVGKKTYDAIGLEFEFIPQGAYISFDYVFGSDEYNEYVGSQFNDVFAFYITSLDGTDPIQYNKRNIAIVPGTNDIVSINKVNKDKNSTWYIDNTSKTYLVEPDGFTKVMTASCAVTPCKTYKLKLVIADVSDAIYDSYIFLKDHSLRSPALEGIVASYSKPGLGAFGVEGCNNVTYKLTLESPAPSGGRIVSFAIAGTATFNVDYTTSPDVTATYNDPLYPGKYYVTIPAGQISTDLSFIPSWDAISEGDETVILTFDVSMCDPSTISADFVIKDNDTLRTSLVWESPVITCNGGPVDIGVIASGGYGSYTYNWAPAGSLSNNTIATPEATPTMNTNYYVTVTDACEATKIDSVLVDFYNPAGQIGVWFGNVSEDWDDCQNWGRAKIPDNTVNVIIPTVCVDCFYPKKTGNIVFGHIGITNGKTITVQDGAQLTVTENVTINDGATFNNVGETNIIVGGHWIDNGNFGRALSTVKFNGGLTQKVNDGIDKNYFFYNIIIDGVDVIFYYNTNNKKINANDIQVNNGKTFTIVKQ